MIEEHHESHENKEEIKTEIKEHEKLETPMNALFVLIGIYVAMILAFPNSEDLPFYNVIYTVFGLLGIIIGVIFGMRLFLFIFRVHYTIPKRLDIHSAYAMENMLTIISFFIIVAILLMFFQIKVTLFGIHFVVVVRAELRLSGEDEYFMGMTFVKLQSLFLRQNFY